MGPFETPWFNKCWRALIDKETNLKSIVNLLALDHVMGPFETPWFLSSSPSSKGFVLRIRKIILSFTSFCNILIKSVYFTHKKILKGIGRKSSGLNLYTSLKNKLFLSSSPPQKDSSSKIILSFTSFCNILICLLHSQKY